MKKKKKSNTPRHKRMKRSSRLQAAKGWISKYEGKNIVRGYSKHYAVDKLCAIKELQILGIHIDHEYIKQLKETLKGKENARKLHKLQKKQEQVSIKYSDSDGTFYYIAGYTSGGVPYGVTWEEMGMKPYGDEDVYKDEYEDIYEGENDEFDFLITNTDGDIPV